MNPVSLGLDGLLALLLLAALAVGVRLNAKLKTLRESQAGFAKAVAELNAAAGRAEAGLAALRHAAQETHDSLLTRIETARTLSARLDRASEDAQAAAAKLEAASARAQIAARAAPPAPPRSEPARSAPRPEPTPPAAFDGSMEAAAVLRLIETAREEAGGAVAPVIGALRAPSPRDAPVPTPEPEPAAAAGGDRLARFVARRREARS